MLCPLWWLPFSGVLLGSPHLWGQGAGSSAGGPGCPPKSLAGSAGTKRGASRWDRVSLNTSMASIHCAKGVMFTLKPIRWALHKGSSSEQLAAASVAQVKRRRAEGSLLGVKHNLLPGGMCALGVPSPACEMSGPVSGVCSVGWRWKVNAVGLLCTSITEHRAQHGAAHHATVGCCKSYRVMQRSVCVCRQCLLGQKGSSPQSSLAGSGDNSTDSRRHMAMGRCCCAASPGLCCSPPGCRQLLPCGCAGSLGHSRTPGHTFGAGMGSGSPWPCIMRPPSHSRVVGASTHGCSAVWNTPAGSPGSRRAAGCWHCLAMRATGWAPRVPGPDAARLLGLVEQGHEELTVPLHIDALRQGLHSDCGSAGLDPGHGAPLSVAGCEPAPSPHTVPEQQCPCPCLGLCELSTSVPHIPPCAAPRCLGELSTERRHSLSAAALLVLTQQQFAEQKCESTRPDLQLFSELLRKGCWSFAGYRNLASARGCAVGLLLCTPALSSGWALVA